MADSSSDSTSESAYGVGMGVGVTREDVQTYKRRVRARGVMVQDLRASLRASNVMLRWFRTYVRPYLKSLRVALGIKKFLVGFPKEVVSMIIRYLLPEHMIRPSIVIQDDVPIVIEIQDDKIPIVID